MGFPFGALAGVIGGLFGGRQSTRPLNAGNVNGPITPIREPHILEASTGWMGYPTRPGPDAAARLRAAETLRRAGSYGTAVEQLRTLEDQQALDVLERTKQQLQQFNHSLGRATDLNLAETATDLAAWLERTHLAAYEDRGVRMYEDLQQRIDTRGPAQVMFGSIDPRDFRRTFEPQRQPDQIIGVGAPAFQSIRQRTQLLQPTKPENVQAARPELPDIRQGLPGPFGRAIAPRAEPRAPSDLVAQNRMDRVGGPERRVADPTGGSGFAQVQQVTQAADRIRSGKFGSGDVQAVMQWLK